MSMAVIDASVAVKWFVPQPLTGRAEAALDWELAAPDLIFAEIGNAVWKYVRAGVMSRDTALSVFKDIEIAYFRPVALDEEIARNAMEIALTLNHPVYDCVYLAVGRKLGWPVLTDDRKLIAAAARGGFDIIALSEF